MAIKKSMARNFLLLNYHAFVVIHPLIEVTFSTPTPVSNSYSRKSRYARRHKINKQRLTVDLAHVSRLY
jgi:hypothetical protein